MAADGTASPNLRMSTFGFAAAALKGWELAGQCCVALLSAEATHSFDSETRGAHVMVVLQLSGLLAVT